MQVSHLHPINKRLTAHSAYTPSGAGLLSEVELTSPDPDGTGAGAAHVTTTKYDTRWGQPTLVVAPDGAKTEATYDILGRIRSVWEPGRDRATYPSEPSSKFDYRTRDDAVTAITTDRLNWDGGYLRSVMLLDGFLRERQVQTQTSDQAVNADGQVIQTTGRLITEKLYDDRGLVIADRGPTFATGAPATTFVNIIDAQVMRQTKSLYDGAGRVRKNTLVSLGSEKWSTTFAYGGSHFNVTPPAGGTATTTYVDARGRETSLRQYHGATPSGTYDNTKYSYTPDGQLASMTDPAGNEWTYKYDLLGRQVTAIDPDSGTSTKTFDLAGQLTTSTDARGEKLAYTYDALGRQTSMRDDSTSGNVRATWAYDTLRKGYPTSSTRLVDGKSITSRVASYDAAGRVLKSEMVVPEIAGTVPSQLAGTYSTTNTYLPDGSVDTSNMSARGNLWDETLNYNYDDLGRLDSLTGNGPYAVGAVRSAYGPLLQIATGRVSPYGAWTTNVYDHGTGRLSRTYFDRETVPKSDYDVRYTYNSAGALTKIATANPQTGSAADTQCFEMDHVQRLRQAWTPSSGDCAATPSATSLGGFAPYWRDWDFDTASNLTKETAHASTGDTVTTWKLPTAGGTGPHAATSQTVTAPGQTAKTTALAYDDAGNVTGRTSTTGAVPGSTGKAQTLTWNPEGRLNTATAGTTSAKFVDTADGERLIRHDNNSTTLYVGGDEITFDQANGSLTSNRYYQFDGQTIAVRTGPAYDEVATLWSDLNNTANWQVNYGTNSIAARRTLPYGQPHGKEWAYLGAHGFIDALNDPDLGLVRIGARDYDPATARFLTPDPILDTADPVQWNPYAYGGGNPVIHPDPTGLRFMAMMPDADTGSTPAAKPSPKRSFGKILVKAVKQTTLNHWTGYATGLSTLADVGWAGIATHRLPGRWISDWVGHGFAKSGRNTNSLPFKAGKIHGQIVGEIALTVATLGIGSGAPVARAGLTVAKTTLTTARAGSALTRAIGALKRIPKVGGAPKTAPPIKLGSAGGPTAGRRFPRSVKGETLADNPGTCVLPDGDEPAPGRPFHPEVARWECDCG